MVEREEAERAVAGLAVDPEAVVVADRACGNPSAAPAVEALGPVAVSVEELDPAGVSVGEVDRAEEAELVAEEEGQGEVAEPELVVVRLLGPRGLRQENG